MEDVRRGLIKAKKNKAPGPGGVRVELLKYGGGKVIQYLTNMYNKIENGEKTPIEWNLSYIISIFKKGDKKCAANYRGISVLPSTINESIYQNY